jgi:hypothetical protein
MLENDSQSYKEVAKTHNNAFLLSEGLGPAAGISVIRCAARRSGRGTHQKARLSEPEARLAPRIR